MDVSAAHWELLAATVSELWWFLLALYLISPLWKPSPFGAESDLTGLPGPMFQVSSGKGREGVADAPLYMRMDWLSGGKRKKKKAWE